MQSNPTKVSLDEAQSPVLIDSQAGLIELSNTLKRHPRIAVDTEANSLYAYREGVCLIQISVPGMDYLVDPLALDDLSPLAPMFESSEVEKIFHAADYDLMVLRRDFGFVTRSIFDTMWAGRILGWPKVGLANVLAAHFDIHPNKRYQRYNWGTRPLDPKALTYAWMDSHYLIALSDIQRSELEAAGRWVEAQEIFDYLTTAVEVPPADHEARHFWRLKGVHTLRPYELKKLYQLYLWRERTAEKLDRPPVKVISSRWLVTLARVQPRSRGELAAVGIAASQVRRYGSEMLDALRSDNVPDPPEPERRPRLPEIVVDRFNRLKAWRKAVAAGRGVDSDVILPNAVLWNLAQNPPENLEALLDVPGIGPWRQATYGPDLLQLVSY